MAAIVGIILLGKQQKKHERHLRNTICVSKQPNAGEYTNKHTASKNRSIIIDTMPFRRHQLLSRNFKLLCCISLLRLVIMVFQLAMSYVLITTDHKTTSDYRFP